MRCPLRTIAAGVCLLMAFLALPMQARAVPVLPSSFYGMIKVNGANVPDGTLVEALVAGKVIAFSYSRTYKGDSVYSVDVAGDDSDTAEVDGGREGETVTFKVGGLVAGETGIWHSGTNTELNLSVSSTATALPPLPTPTLLPTQTAITVPTRAAPTETAPGQGGGEELVPAATKAASPSEETSRRSTPISVIIALLAGAVVLLGGAALLTWKRWKK